MANRIQDTAGDRMFYRVNAILLMLLTLSVLYPIIYVLANSFSSPAAVSSGKVYLWPLDPSVEGYRRVLENPNILRGFLNSVFYTVVGTAINLAMTMIAAYPMARKDLPLRSFFSVLFAFTMLFGGGMIPNYILIMKLGMLNTRWALLLPGALSVYNMIIARTAMQSLPDELLEAAYIDGCSDARYFVRIVLPLSGATIAVLALYYAVGHWNSYFSAFMYLSDRSKYPLQIVLREILIMGQIAESDITDLDSAERIQGLSQLLKYALIVISSAPMMLIYPFVQKYFVKGVMIGSLKG